MIIVPVPISKEFAKPANTLIERVSDAIGGYCKPRQIKRVALAEATAEKIRTESKIEITDLERRAAARWLAEEGMKQKNIEDITSKALPHVTNEAKPENMEKDWLVNFFDKGRLISDHDMQELWAKVLAGEANNPGKFSKRTVNLMASLDKKDAELFTKLCCFVMQMDGTFPAVYDINHAIYNDRGIGFESLEHLDTIGLISMNPINGYVKWRTGEPSRAFALYFDNIQWLDIPPAALFPSKLEFPVGAVIFTSAGQELASVTTPSPIEGFFDYLKTIWVLKGVKLASGPNENHAPV